MINTLTSIEFDKLIDKASKLLLPFPHLEAGDIVNDVVIETMESGEPLHLHELLKKVYYKAKNTAYQKTGYTNPIKISKSEKTRSCATCHEEKPICDFYLVRRKLKNAIVSEGLTEEVLYSCKDCHYKAGKERLKQMSSKGIVNHALKKAQQKYCQKPSVKEARSKHGKEYFRRPGEKEKQAERCRLNYLKRREKELQHWVSP